MWTLKSNMVCPVERKEMKETEGEKKNQTIIQQGVSVLIPSLMYECMYNYVCIFTITFYMYA